MLLIHGLFFVFLGVLVPQPQEPTTANPGTVGAGQASTAHAPDEATGKITELVHAGKYNDAKQLTAALLIAYPDDQRLIKAKILIDKLLAPKPSGSPIPSNRQQTQSAGDPSSGQLTGMDKVNYNAVILLARQAQQTADLDEQTKLLEQFMSQSGLFLRMHPDQMLLWQLRAEIALTQDDVLAGYEAGQRLLAVGAADSSDATLQNLLGRLKNKGWFEADAAAAAKRQAELISKYGWMQGEWSESFSQPYTYRAPDGFMSSMKTHTNPGLHAYKETFEVSKSEPVIGAFIVDSSGKTKWVPTKFTLADSGELRCELYIDQEHAYKQASSCEIDEDRRILKLVVVREGQSESHAYVKTGGGHPSTAASPAAPMEKQTGTRSTSTGVPSEDNPAPPAVTSLDVSAPALSPVSSTAKVAVSTNTATLHVYRMKHIVGSAQSYGVYVDGKKVVPIQNGQTVSMLIATGKHSISIAVRGIKTRKPIDDLDMAAGSECWVRVDVGAGFPLDYFIVTLVPSEQAKAESKKLEEIKMGDLSKN